MAKSLEITLTACERALLADVVAIQAQRERELARAGYQETVYGIVPATTWDAYLMAT